MEETPQERTIRLREANRIKMAKWRAKNPGKAKECRARRKDKARAYNVAYAKAHPEVQRRKHRKWALKNRQRQAEYMRVWRLEVKKECFEAYGGCRCACPGCPITAMEFLTIDHIKPLLRKNGVKHKGEHGGEICLWLKRHGYPDKDKYQVLCANCNLGKGRKECCPLRGKPHCDNENGVHVQAYKLGT